MSLRTGHEKSIGMGKGDKKSKRGKINSGTYGVRRTRKKKKPSATPTKKKAKAKTKAKK